MRRTAFIYTGLFSILPLLASHADSIHVAQKPRAIIAGCENNIADTAWKDQRINFGITGMIAEQVADSGCFALIEAKPEIREKLTAIQQGIWVQGGRKPLKELEYLIQPAPVIIIGRIVSFGAPVTTVGFGGFGAAHSEVVLEVEVDVALPGGKTFTGRGTGRAVKSATAVLFTFRENGVFFDQTTIGTALKDAVSMATADALKRYSKYERK